MKFIEVKGINAKSIDATNDSANFLTNTINLKDQLSTVRGSN